MLKTISAYLAYRLLVLCGIIWYYYVGFQSSFLPHGKGVKSLLFKENWWVKISFHEFDRS